MWRAGREKSTLCVSFFNDRWVFPPGLAPLGHSETQLTGLTFDWQAGYPTTATLQPPAVANEQRERSKDGLQCGRNTTFVRSEFLAECSDRQGSRTQFKHSFLLLMVLFFTNGKAEQRKIITNVFCLFSFEATSQIPGWTWRGFFSLYLGPRLELVRRLCALEEVKAAVRNACRHSEGTRNPLVFPLKK